MVAVGCKESTTEPPPPEPPPNENSEDYFPNSDGNYYYYNIFVSDSLGSQSGTKTTYYYGDTTLQQTPYQIEVDTFNVNGINLSVNLFRKVLLEYFIMLISTLMHLIQLFQIHYAELFLLTRNIVCFINLLNCIKHNDL